MKNPGMKSLGDVALAAINAATAATTVTSAADASGQTQAYVDGLEGARAALISINFNCGGGGGALKVTVEFTPDQGTTWIEVARAAFTTASAQKLFNLSALTAKVAAYTPAALSDDTAVDGIIAPRCRARILKSGSDYSGNTSLAIRLIAA